MNKLALSHFCVWLVVSLAVLARADDLGIRAPDGFEVSLFAGDDLAHDIYSMTVDPKGRIVVAGAGYIKVLHDDDGDGKADRVTQFSDVPKSGAHGMLADGAFLYATGDNGIWKFTDRDGDGIADGPPEKWIDGLAHPEHGCNGIERGPDGWIYVICGNDAGVTEKFVTSPDSPVTKPNCGTILRISSDGEQREILAHGFRNPYDLCFHPDGNLFTVDADGERDHHLPWYAPNRLFDVAIGMHHGWVLRGWQWSWNRPAYYFDSVERCAEIGRGSPTGMLCYRHTNFPQQYRGGIFSACWTLGRIYHYPLTRRGSTFDGKVDLFLETTGTTGFAPVDMVVGPDGSMYVAIGGRRTRGSVFRITYAGPVSELRREPANDLKSVLDAPQPLSAWSRAKWLPVARKLKQADLEAAVLNEDFSQSGAFRAIEVITEMHGPLKAAAAEKLIHNKTPEIAARGAWNVGQLGKADDVAKILGEATKVESPIVQRAAWEALQGTRPRDKAPIDAAWAQLENRRVRAARIMASIKGWNGNSKSPDDFWRPFFAETPIRSLPKRNGIGPLSASFGSDPSQPQWLDGVPQVSKSILNPQSLRLFVLALGDVSLEPGKPESPPGYTLAFPIKRLVHRETNKEGKEVTVPAFDPAKGRAAKLAELVSAADARLLPEVARIFALLEDPAGAPAIEPISALLTADSSPTDDIHYLMCLSRMPGERTEAARKSIAAGIARLDGKMKARGWFPSRNWPDRVGETLAALAKFDEELPAAVIEHEAFKSPAQAFLFTRLDAKHQAAAAAKLMRRMTEDEEDQPWTTELVALVAALPQAESLPALRKAWDEPAVRDAILLQLVKTPEAEDRERFVEALSSIDPIVVEKSATALTHLDIEPTDEHWLAVMQALRQACSAPPAKAARTAIAELAEEWSGQEIVVTEKDKSDDLLASYQPWFAWFAKEHPKIAAKLNAATGDTASWKERLAKIDWASGDAVRGKLSFEKRSCVKCHAGTSPLGPDLNGAAGRFSKEDLMSAIVDPSKDVSPLYQATQIVTGSGRIYHGLVIYESPDGTLLTTGPDTTIRIAGDEIVSMRKSRLSLMPTGLMANANDSEIADLVAYLQTLRGKK